MDKEVGILLPVGTWGTGIAKGSAIVSALDTDGEPLCPAYYEGGIYQTDMGFEEKLTHAAGRLTARYPTSALSGFRPGDVRLVAIGAYDRALRHWVVSDYIDPEALTSWISPATLPRVGGSDAVRSRAAGYNAMRLRPSDFIRLQMRHHGEDLINAINDRARSNPGRQ